MVGLPFIISRLHPDPEAGSVSKQLTQADSDYRANHFLKLF
jgi:hypothetical protein